jgi:cysteine peptidase C11 family protein
MPRVRVSTPGKYSKPREVPGDQGTLRGHGARQPSRRRRRRAAPKNKRRVKKILIYMSTTKPDLVDLARSAQQKVQDALRRARDEDRHLIEQARRRRVASKGVQRGLQRDLRRTKDAKRKLSLEKSLQGERERDLRAQEEENGTKHYGADRAVQIDGLVHGYQTGGALEVGSSRFSYRLDGTLDVTGLQGPTTLGFVPGDETMISEWVREALSPEKARKGELLDSTMLIFWGHGAGIGTTLTLPESAPGQTAPEAVPHPGLLNIGGLKDGALARHLSETLRTVERDGCGRIGVLVFDSCLMSGVELAYEYRELADYVVASQSLVETAPGGPPGLNLGEVVTAFLKDSTWGPLPRDPRADLRDAATQIAHLVGDRRSGAQQLTAFGVQAQYRGSEDGTPSWLRPAIRWLEEHALERESEFLLEQIRFARLGNGKVPALQPMFVRAAAALEASKRALGIDGLLWLFARLLNEASFDPGERDRILVAFRNTAYRNVRQFLDLRDLASQVLQSSQNRLLQLVALALMAELTPGNESFVVAHRLAAPLEEKVRLSGVSIYCPWFRARNAPGAPHVFDVTIDHARYRKLDLPRITGWADFVFGPLFERTSAERSTNGPPASRPHGRGPRHECVLDRLVECLCGSGCACGSEAHGGAVADAAGRVLGEGKPSGPLVDGKPSGPLLDGKPSGPLGPSS